MDNNISAQPKQPTSSSVTSRLIVALVIQLLGAWWFSVALRMGPDAALEDQMGPFMFGGALYILGLISTIIIAAQSWQRTVAKIAIVISATSLCALLVLYFMTSA